MRRLSLRTRAFPSLRALELDRGHSDLPSWSFNALDELVRSRGGFKRLGLASPKEGPGFERLIARGELQSLESLSITSAVAFGDHEAEALAAATQLTRLRELDLSRQQISSVGAKALIAAPHLQRLRRLSLHHNQRSGAAAFASARGLQELELLDLRHNSIQAHGPATERLRQRFGGAVRVADDPA